MIRKIIQIDEDQCNGCGLCSQACHEGAIAMIDGKAKLMRDDYCDGLGDCLPACPTGAITFVEREALPYNEAAVKANQAAKQKQAGTHHLGCPGTRTLNLKREKQQIDDKFSQNPSRLSQWPIQLKLVPITAPFFKNAKLLIAADCTAFCRGDFHERFIRNHITLIGCPKLDMGDYSEKITAILQNNDIKSVTVVRMDVPCCGGLEYAVKTALQESKKFIPWQVVTISTDGNILD